MAHKGNDPKAHQRTCKFEIEDGRDRKITGHGPNPNVARRAAVNKFDWEDHHKNVEISCDNV